ncbi:glycoside hydrolase family 5 protein [Xylona heveae TC161]|uniref:Glycoside hydrolase family 5 protein n=1 Tax=Xylona heveae (strain CBS 132557 / TC161) TaxID=1328760 RepID=A0A165GHF8_XYLHT|nr:glycoside hydrolase family 5 protein [Xylona heveae TC161]KZF22188.1 glycoside hydrolase family 5 protein [Xylona heveae TC161]
MKSFIKKAKASLRDVQSQFPSSQGNQAQQQIIHQQDTPSRIQPPTPTDILRYRYHHGTNLGSIFVLEQWLTPSMFVEGAAGGSELDAVNACLKSQGLDATRAKWENHWSNAVSDSDFSWLVNTAHCTTIRLPIGYFTLGPAFTNNTPFAGAPAQVYVNAWNAVKTFVARARSHGIGVLLDLHALPGGANGDAHSGTSSGKADLWGNSGNLSLAQQCLVFMAQEARAMDGVVGLQLCNEAIWDAPGMYAWYDSVIGAILHVDNTMPLYISDAWNLRQAVSYCDTKNTLAAGFTNPIIVDTHKYYCFSDANKAETPQQIIAGVPQELGELNGKQGDVFTHGAAQVIVGEYSCVMDGQTWAKVSDADRPGLVEQFGHVESQTWQQKAGGSYFWTYKMDWMDGGEWGFVQQTNSSAITPPPNLLLAVKDVQSRIGTAQSQRQSRRDASVTGHENYWHNAAPGQTFEFWRYAAGWDVGFSDAMVFFQAREGLGLSGLGADKIGCLDVWVRKRILESGQAGPFVWEFEQGVRAGINDFYQAAGI